MHRLLIALSISAAATGVLASQETPPVAAVETIAAVSTAQTTMTVALSATTAGPKDAAKRGALAPAADGKGDGSDDADGSITAALMLMMAVVMLRRRVANSVL